MGTLSSELAPHAERLTPRPRIYADANVPAGLVAYMRQRLHWDVLFVIEDDDLRRASDVTHFRLAHQLRRTLVTHRSRLPGRSAVSAGGDERRPRHSGARRAAAHRAGRPGEQAPVPPDESALLPVEGRKLHLHTDWTGTL